MNRKDAKIAKEFFLSNRNERFDKPFDPTDCSPCVLFRLSSSGHSSSAGNQDEFGIPSNNNLCDLGVLAVKFG
jgi:hypothetical protein